jgi:hypothetical protein
MQALFVLDFLQESGLRVFETADAQEINADSLWKIMGSL